VAPRARGTAADADSDTSLGNGAESAAAPADETSAIAEALAQLGADERAYILVHKADAGGPSKGWAYCARYQVGHFDLDAVRDQFGAGRYKAVIVRSNGKHFRQIEFLIAASIFPLAAPAAPAVHLQGHQVAGAASSSLVEQLVLKSVEGTQTLMAAIVTALVGGGGGVKGSDLVAAFREGREATGGNGTDKTLEAIRLGVELSGGGGAGDTDPLLALAGPLMSLIERGLARPQTVVPARAPHLALVPGRTSAPMPRASAPHATPPAPNSSDGAGGDVASDFAATFVSLTKQWMPVMLKEARSGRDGYTWGCYMAERVKATFQPHLLMLAQAEPAERRSLLTSFEPELAEHFLWVEAAAEGILNVLKPEDDEGEDEELDADPRTTAADGAALGGSRGDGDGAHDARPDPSPGGPTGGEGARGED
jgi:hypothetical protein